MAHDEIAGNTNGFNPDHRYGLSKQLFSAIPGTPATQAKEQAQKIMDCARYLNHTGVMLGDPRRVAASHHLSVMVRTLADDVLK